MDYKKTAPSKAFKLSNLSGDAGVCLIATAAYGSYNHPDVILLKKTLNVCFSTSDWGKGVLLIYQDLSRPVALLVAKHNVLRYVSRLVLMPIIFFSRLLIGFGGIFILLVISFGYILPILIFLYMVTMPRYRT
jgi:hypothetical protein